MDHSNVKIIKDEDGFNRALIDSVTKFVIIDFHATWCGPCRMIGPIFKKMATEYSDRAKFYSLDVDDVASVAEKEAIEGMPTIHFYKNAKRVHKFMGTKEKLLRSTIEDVVGITKDRERAEKARKEREIREKEQARLEQDRNEQQQQLEDDTITEQDEDEDKQDENVCEQSEMNTQIKDNW